MNPIPKDVIIGNQWLVLSKIGEGSFGEVFKAKDIGSNHLYAIKREPIHIDYPQLNHENIIYKILNDGPCIPKCHWFGQYEEYNCIVIDLLGSSLKDLQQTVRYIPLDIVIQIGCQLINCLEYIHDKGLIYRDIKPENFLFSHTMPKNTNSCRNIMNQWNDPSLFIIDFGLVSWWRNPKTNKPYPESKKPIKYKTGTARYASLNVHRGQHHARRDDMESLGYLILDLLLSGELPWSGITARTCKAGWDKLKSIKQEILLQDLCLGLPQGIMNFIDYTRRLKFSDRPDYDYLRRLLIGCNEPGPFSKIITPNSSNKMIPSPPRYPPKTFVKRRASIHLPQNHHHFQQNDDVFIMDDLIKELPSSPQNNSKKYHSSSSQNYYRNRKKFHPHNNRNHLAWDTRPYNSMNNNNSINNKW